MENTKDQQSARLAALEAERAALSEREDFERAVYARATGAESWRAYADYLAASDAVDAWDAKHGAEMDALIAAIEH